MTQQRKFNIHVPKWAWFLYGIIITCSVVAILFSNKVVDVLFKAKWIESIFRHIITPIIMIIALLHMVMSNQVLAVTTYVPEMRLGEPEASIAPPGAPSTPPTSYLYDTSAYRHSPLTSTLVSTNNLAYVPSTEIVSWHTNQDGTIYVTTSDGNTHPVQNLSLCGAIIFVGILGTAVTIGGCKLVQCAKRKLYGTNAPSTNAPNLRMFNLVNGSPATRQPLTGNSLGGFKLNLPEGFTPNITNMFDNDIDVADASELGWRDWQGNLIVRQFGITVWPTNVMVGNNPCKIQSSTNILDASSWMTESFSVTGWVSAASAFAPYTNVLTVTFDQYGVAFATNWYSLQLTNNGDYNTVTLGSVSSVPRRTSTQLFFRAVIEQ
ncbi:MAG: hypothetical protein KBC33_02470 [Candidatus Pacebacteria bacterium]|nr:hypothetical protein [Candidatus Paceibacterota bacterium]